MNGARFLLDTNIILGILKETEAAKTKVEDVPFEACCYSKSLLIIFLKASIKMPY